MMFTTFDSKYAGVVKLADTQDLGSCAARCAGSSPVTRTKDSLERLYGFRTVQPFCVYW